MYDSKLDGIVRDSDKILTLHIRSDILKVIRIFLTAKTQFKKFTKIILYDKLWILLRRQPGKRTQFIDRHLHEPVLCTNKSIKGD